MKKKTSKVRLTKKTSSKMNNVKAFSGCDCGWAKIGWRDTTASSIG